jgi:hypothetical protein
MRATVLSLALLLLLLYGYLQRETLLRAALGHMLASQSITLLQLDGLRLGLDALHLERAELLLDGTRQLDVSGLVLRYQLAAAWTLPTLQTLHIDALRLQSAAADTGSLPASTLAAMPAASVNVAALLQLLRNFPLASIDIDTLELPGLPYALRAGLQASPGRFEVLLRSPVAGSALLTLLQADPDSATQLQLQAQLDPLLRGELQFSLPPDTAAGQLAGSGQFDLSGLWQQQPWQASGMLLLPACSLARSDSCTMDFTGLQATLAAYIVPGVTADTALQLRGLQLAGSGRLGLDLRTLTLARDTTLGLALLQSTALEARELTLHTRAPLTLQRGDAGLQWQLQGSALSGSVGGLGSGAYHLASTFEVEDLHLQQTDMPAGSLRLRTQALMIDSPQAWLPAVDVDLALALQAEQIDFEGLLQLREGNAASPLRVQGRQHLASGSGSAALILEGLVLSGEGSSLRSWLGPWPGNGDLLQGHIDAALQLQWQAQQDSLTEAGATRLTGSLDADLKALAGFYQNSFFRGFNTTVRADFDTARAFMFSTQPLQLQLDELDVGLPLRELDLAVQLEPDGRLLIASLQGSLLGGRITALGQSFDFSASDNALTLYFADLRLEQLLALTEYEGLSVEGGVSGEVPLHFSADGIEVAGGRLVAQQPGGSIRYLGTLGQGSANLELVRQALSNYQFDRLESSIDYAPDGELLLSMQLQGINPTLEGGRPVHLNLNLSDNVPALLRSLQAGRAIEDLLQALYE